MVQEKLCEYKKAYVELLELLKHIAPEQRMKIPDNLIKEMEKNKDKNYTFTYDFSKALIEQNFMPKTKALLLQLYIKYLSQEEEQDFWNKYKKLCLKSINEEKKKNYDSENYFNKEKKNIKIKDKTGELAITVQKENIFIKIYNIIKNIFNYWR